MYKTILEYWNPRNETVVTKTGYCYLDTTSVITGTKNIFGDTEIGLFDTDKDLLVLSKLQSPVQRMGVQQFLVKFDF